MSKTTELFSMIHANGVWADGISNGDIHKEMLTAEAVHQQKSLLDSVGMGNRFRFESMGFFTSKEVRYAINSMSQAEIDAGGDNEIFEQTKTIWTKVG